MNRLSRAQIGWVVAILGCVLSSPTAATDVTPGPRITHGVAAGEVSSTSAVIWSRCERAADLRVALDAGGREIAASAAATDANDFTAKVTINGLSPDTAYPYRAWCTAGTGDVITAGDAMRGALHTAPVARSPRPVTFVWSGDVGGQNVCRDAREGYAIFRTIADLHPAFFIGLGDMIYGDSVCLAKGRYGNRQIPGPPTPATDVSEFWAYWKYNRADEASQRLLASTPYYAVWDDHEVLNDFGPQRDVGPSPPYPPGRHLLPLGRKAFLDYNPFPDPMPRLYRSVRWGKHLELFMLDTRSYRDANEQRDDPQHPKTLLGSEQLRWLKDGLRRSDATWKVIVSSVPLSVTTCLPERGCDGWMNFDQQTGFEYELLDIMRFLQQHGIRNPIWISTDIHFVSVFRFTPFPADPTFQSYEIDTGPLNAGVFPKSDFDRTLHPTQLFRYPDNADPAQGFVAATSWFNFGVMRIDAQGDMRIEVINTSGKQLYDLALHPPR